MFVFEVLGRLFYEIQLTEKRGAYQYLGLGFALRDLLLQVLRQAASYILEAVRLSAYRLSRCP